ncbi:lipid II flippase MurJ, partial [Kitasatospora sp. NPDC054768]
MTAALGTDQVADAYNVANTLPNTVSFLFFGSVLNAAFVPELVRIRQADQVDGIADVERLLAACLIAMAALSVAAVFAAPRLVDAPGCRARASTATVLTVARLQLLGCGLVVCSGWSGPGVGV